MCLVAVPQLLLRLAMSPFLQAVLCVHAHVHAWRPGSASHRVSPGSRGAAATGWVMVLQVSLVQRWSSGRSGLLPCAAAE